MQQIATIYASSAKSPLRQAAADSNAANLAERLGGEVCFRGVLEDGDGYRKQTTVAVMLEGILKLNPDIKDAKGVLGEIEKNLQGTGMTYTQNPKKPNEFTVSFS